jgi:glutamyl-tRNA reductase
MTVLIIGSGKMGSGFARLLASKGFDIAIGNKNPEKAIALAEEIGEKAKGQAALWRLERTIHAHLAELHLAPLSFEGTMQCLELPQCRHPRASHSCRGNDPKPTFPPL